MEITEYKHTSYKARGLMNKELFPQTTFNWTEYEKFNEVYQWARENCIKGKQTLSGGIAGGPYNRYHSIYFYNKRKASIELIVAHHTAGCYKFVISTAKNEDNTNMTGRKALKTVLKLAEDFGVIDTFREEAVSKEEGAEIKKEIQSPIIKTMSQMYEHREFEHCHHLDANSSYFSRLVEEYPALKPLGEYLFRHRKENNGKYKAVMTNSIGAMQSQYCLDINNKYYNTAVPFQLSKFAKVAVNGTNDFIKYYIKELVMNDFEPILINTDGIWYRSKDKTDRAYHDSKEGIGLCGWKHDHKDVKLYIKSPGAYQYIEDGKVKTVLRGTCALDYIKPDRDTWEWREIADQVLYKFKFDEEKGVVRYENE